MSEHRDYWDAFYAGRVSNAVPAEPSAFAHWTREQLPAGQPLVEFGFGNARDALWFARNGHSVTGYDFADSAVRQAQGRADGEALTAEFFELDLYDVNAVEQAAKVISDARPTPALYGRFLIHAMEAPGRHNLFDLAAAAGGDIYLEFRTGEDRATRHAFGEDHYRTYLDPEVVADELRKRGASIVHSEAGHGLAVYKSEDPHVARLVARFESES